MAKNNDLHDYLLDLYEGISAKIPDASRNPQDFRSVIDSLPAEVPTLFPPIVTDGLNIVYWRRNSNNGSFNTKERAYIDGVEQKSPLTVTAAMRGKTIVFTSEAPNFKNGEVSMIAPYYDSQFVAGEDITLFMSTDAGKVIVNGRGAMTDFKSHADVPWGLSDRIVKEVDINPGVTTVGNRAFSNFTALMKVVIGNTVTSIGDAAFDNCCSLTSVTIPNIVTHIGHNAFCCCMALANLVIPDGVTYIGFQAFSFCDSLTRVVIPDSVTDFMDAVFYGCTTLASVTIGKCVPYIGNNVFWSCPALASVAFRGTPNNISNSAFSSCTNLTDIYVPWSEGEVAGAPWGATNATIHYNCEV